MSGPLLALTMLNNLVAGRMSGAQLDATLTDPADGSALGGFLYVMQQHAPLKQITISAPAMTAVVGSPVARESFLNSEYRVGHGLNTLAVAGGAVSNSVLTTMASVSAIAVNGPAMGAILVSPTGLAVLLASSTTMTTMAGSSVAMTAFAANAAAMTALAGSAPVIAVIVSSTTAMTAIFASATAMPIVAASVTMMTAITASAAASAALWASDIASDAVLTSSVAKLAVYNSDIALAALQATPTQVQRQISLSGRVTLNSSPPGGSTILANGVRTILLRRYYDNAPDYELIGWARGSTITGVGQGPTGGGRQLYTGAVSVGCESGSYTPRTAEGSNTTTGNFVSAANGLVRNYDSRSIRNLYVYHIPVGV